MDLRQDEGLLPEVVKEVEFGEFGILLHDEDIENVHAALLIDRVSLQSVDVVDAVERKVVLAHGKKILACFVVWVILDLNVAGVASTTATRGPTHVRALRRSVLSVAFGLRTGRTARGFGSLGALGLFGRMRTLFVELWSHEDARVLVSLLFDDVGMGHHALNLVLSEEKLARAEVPWQSMLADAGIERVNQDLVLVQFGDKSAE